MYVLLRKNWASLWFSPSSVHVPSSTRLFFTWPKLNLAPSYFPLHISSGPTYVLFLSGSSRLCWFSYFSIFRCEIPPQFPGSQIKRTIFMFPGEHTQRWYCSVTSLLFLWVLRWVRGHECDGKRQRCRFSSQPSRRRFFLGEIQKLLLIVNRSSGPLSQHPADAVSGSVFSSHTDSYLSRLQSTVIMSPPLCLGSSGKSN